MQRRSVISSVNPTLFSARTALLTMVAMLCFAANSLLCRLALATDLIDPATFTTVRVLSAVTILAAILIIQTKRLPDTGAGSWRSAATLFGYLVFFSFAYTRLSTGTGALILFGAVQLTMFVVALRQGEHLPTLSWAALALAVFGLVYLVLPGVTAPDPLGAAFMVVSGAAWGLFSLLARGTRNPVEATLGNFLRCVPLVGLVSLCLSGQFKVTAAGLGLAVISGAIASGLGYAVWYAALRELPRTHAATVQLSVPAIAAFGGVIFLSEPITVRLLFASIALLGGVAIVLTQQPPPKSAADVRQ